jgi:coenzyme PQQ precursor peptide PqqA
MQAAVVAYYTNARVNRPVYLLMTSTKSVEECGMAWKTPKIIEISLGAEINSYACAELA